MPIEIIILIGVGIFALFAVLSIFFGKKKKKDGVQKKEKEKKGKKSKGKKEETPKGEKKVEPVYKKTKQEEDKEEVKEEPAKTEEQKEQIKEAGFKIIRKKSQIKINKKALKADSRNPSITKVFKDGKRIDGSPNDSTMSGITTEDPDEFDLDEEMGMIPSPTGTEAEVGRFGTREVKYEDKVNGKEYQMKTPEGSPNRAPILGDRTNFGSHLRVSDDNNLSGVSGTGIAKAVQSSELQGKDIDQKTEDLVNRIRQNMLGARNDVDPVNFLGGGLDYGRDTNAQDKSKNQIDAKTIIIGEVLSKRKGVPPKDN